MKGRPCPANRKPSPFKGKPGRKHTEEEKLKISQNQGKNTNRLKLLRGMM